MDQEYLSRKRADLKRQLEDAQRFMEAEQDDPAIMSIIAARQTLDEILFVKEMGRPSRDFSEVLEWRRKGAMELTKR